MEKTMIQACARHLADCGCIEQGANLLVVTEPAHFELGMAMWTAAAAYPNRSMVMMERGDEPTAPVMAAMMAADVVISCTDCPLPGGAARVIEGIPALDR